MRFFDKKYLIFVAVCHIDWTVFSPGTCGCYTVFRAPRGGKCYSVMYLVNGIVFTRMTMLISTDYDDVSNEN